jgi:hypothetical protein
LHPDNISEKGSVRAKRAHQNMKTSLYFQRLARFLRPAAQLSVPGLLSVLILGGSEWSARSQAYNPPLTGLVGWWKGDGNGNDSASTNNGVVANNVSFVPGLFGQAFNFPGAGPGFVYVPDNNAFKLTNSLTIAAWVNSAPGSWVILSRGDYNTLPYYITFDAGGRLIFVMNFSTAQQAFLYPTNVVPFNTWTHIAGTLDGATGDMRVYINGNLVSEMTTPYRPIADLNPAQNPGIGIGANSDDDTGYLFHGYIDEVLLYSRALSPSEITALASTNCNPHGATATATVVNGFVVGATIMDTGCGYTNTPQVLIQGGGGTGAMATAVVSNGVVVSITINNAGSGYTSTPSIYVSFPLTITSQPHSLTVNAFDPAAFTVAASGTAPLSYHWALNGTNIPGATSNTLVITNVMQSDLGIYTVSVTDMFTSATSSNATLSMYPYILTPFTGAVTYWGTNVSFPVVAWGSPLLSYQWFRNGAPVPGATNDTLTFASIDFTNAGLYTVVVSNPLGSVTNAPAQIIVNPAGVSIGLSPRISISGVVGVNYIIQRTTNLNDTNSWTTLTTLTLTQPVQVWVDTNIDATFPTNPRNFYRVFPGP